MKIKKTLVLLFLSINLVGIQASAEESEECSSNDLLKASRLSCVSCGLTKYYKNKPSHRWLALLAVRAREKGFGLKDNNPLTSLEAEKEMQKRVIMDLQLYGYCENYKPKNFKGGGIYHDLSASEWLMLSPFIKESRIPSEKSYAALAEKMGFKDPGFLSSGTAKSNFDLLFEGSYGSETFEQKKIKFKEKLISELEPDVENASRQKIVGTGDKDQGLRSCLSEVNQKFFEPSKSDQESYDMCVALANECDIERDPKDFQKDFCARNGMKLRKQGGSNFGTPPPPPTSPRKEEKRSDGRR